MEIESDNAKLGQDQIMREVECPTGTLHGYRNDISIFSHYRIPQKKSQKKTKDFKYPAQRPYT